mgnify:FL=1
MNVGSVSIAAEVRSSEEGTDEYGPGQRIHYGANLRDGRAYEAAMPTDGGFTFDRFFAFPAFEDADG